jgi:hypothetical protein
MSNKANETTEGNLKDFKWDESESFFGIKDQPVKDPLDVEDEDENPSDETKNEDANKEDKKEVEKETKKDDVPFAETTTDESPNEDGEGSEEEATKLFTTLATDLVERKIFKNVEIKAGEPITEEKFFELQDAELESRVEEAITDLVTEIGEEGADYIKAIKSGVKNHEFFKAMALSAEIPQFDVADEKTYDPFLRYYYRTVEGLDEEDISDKLEWLTENGKKIKYAEKYHEQVTRADTKRKEQLVKDAEKANRDKLEDHKNFVKAITTTLIKTDKVGNFPFTKTDKTSLASFITEPVKLPNGRYATQLQIAVNKIMYQEDKSKLLLLAKLLKNDFDVSDIVTEVQSTVTRKTKSELANQKQGLKPTTSSTRRKSLSDYF